MVGRAPHRTCDLELFRGRRTPDGSFCVLHSLTTTVLHQGRRLLATLLILYGFVLSEGICDAQAASVNSVTSSTANGSYRAGQSIAIEIFFDQPVYVNTAGGTPTLTLETGVSDAVVSYSSGSGTSTLVFSYIVAIGHTSSDLQYLSTAALALNGGTVTDGSSANATLTLPSLVSASSLGGGKSLVVDTTAPSATLSTTASNPTKTSPIPVTITFSESVTGFTQGDITVGNGSISSVSGTGASYTAQIAPSAQGIVTIDVAAGVATDAAGNSSTAASQLVRTYDSVAPTVMNVTSTTPNGTYNAGQAISIRMQMSEVVTVTGVPQLTLETGASDAVVSYVSGSGTSQLVFTYTIASGHYSSDLDYASTTALSLNGGTIRDAATNNATVTLPSPGAAGSLGANSALVADAVAPTVTGVSSTAPNGTYKVGDVLDIQVIFSEQVVVTGTPRLTLETGASDAVVNYSGATGTPVSSLTFSYTVASSHTSADLDLQSTTALALNGGTILDSAGNAASLTVPIGATAGSLSGAQALVIDGSSPTVSSVSSTKAAGSYKAGEVISIQVTFSEAVTVSGTPQVTLETGATDAVISYASGTGTATLNFSYTVSSGHASSDLDYTSTTALALNGGSITDLAGNSAIITLASPGAANSLGANEAIVIDTTAPTVTTVTSSTTNGSYRAGQSINVQVSFSESVTVTGTPQITLETGSSDAVVNYASGTGSANLSFTYTIQAGHTSSDLDYVSTGALTGTITDAAGNTAVATLPAPGGVGSLAGNKALIVDTTSPTSTLSTGLSSPTSTYPIPVTITFPESVTGLALTDFTVTNGCVSNLVGSGASYTVNLNPTSNSTVTLSLPAARVTDTAGNANTAATPLSISFYTDAPRVTSVSSTSLNTSYKAGELISVQVNFSDAVTVSGTPRLTLETGTSDALVNYSSGSGSSSLTFNYTVAAGHNSSDLDYQSVAPLSLNGGSIVDTATATYDAAFIFACPGTTGSLASNEAIVVDTTKPTVSSVTSATANGSYKAGTSIGVTVTFSEAVYVTGTPQITLETGLIDGVASYVSGSGTTALVFSYTVQSGHNSSDLDYASTSALSVNGGSIKDFAGNDATVTLATPGAANSLGNAKSIIVDTVAPSVLSVTASNANGSYTVGTMISPQVVFSETVIVTGTPDLALDVGVRTAGATYTSGSSSATLVFNYSIQSGDTSSDLAYTSASALSINGGAIRDAAGNDALVTLSSPGVAGSLNWAKNIVIDTTAPTVVGVYSTTSDGIYTVGGSISILVEFSEAVTVTGVPQLTMEVGAGGNATYVSGSGTTTLTMTYSVLAGHSSADLDYDSTNSLTGTIRDAATNAAVLTLPVPGAVGSISDDKEIQVDTTAPTVVSVTSSTADGHYNAGDSIYLTVIFSEPINVVGSPTLTVETGSVDGVATYAGGSGSTEISFQYTIGAGENSADLDVVTSGALSVHGGSLRDAATNSATLTIATPALSPSHALVVDTTEPGVSISSIASPATNISPIKFAITFTEAVVGFDLADLVVTNGVADNLVSVSSSVYSVEVTPSGEGDVEISVPQNVVADLATNVNTGSSVVTVTYDTTAPTVSLSSLVGGSFNTSSFTVAISLSEAASDFDVSDITVGNGTLSNFSGSGTSYSVDVSPIAEGDVEVSVASGSAHDLAGNGTLGSNTLSRTYDVTGPMVVVSSTSTLSTNLNPFVVIFTFNEGVYGFTVGDLNVTNGSASNFVAVSDTLYTVDVQPAAEGVVEISVVGGVAQDSAGNDTIASAAFSRIYDETSPTVTLSSTAPAVTNTSIIPIVITFNEDVTGFGSADISVTNGTVSSLSGSGSVYTAEVVPSADGVVTVSVGSGVAVDSASNGNTPSLVLSRTVDRVGASVTITSSVGQICNTVPFSVTFTFSEWVSGFDVGDISVTNGAASNLTGSGAVYTADITPSAEGEVTVSIPAGVVVDFPGNSNVASAPLSRIYDVAAPSVSLSTSLPNPTNTNPMVLSVAFSESVVGLSTGDFTVVNGSVSALTGSGTTYIASVAPAGEGEVRVSLSSGMATDAAGNGNLASNVVTRMYDSAAPDAPVITSPLAASILTTNVPLVTGTSEPSVQVEVRNAAGSLCSTTSDSSGLWSCNLSQVAEGRHSLRAYATDSAGNRGVASTTVPIVIDAVPLMAPLLISGGSEITSDKTPRLSGAGAPGTIVMIRLGGATICSAIVDSTGFWSCDTTELPTGVHSLIAWAQDPADDTVSVDVPLSVFVGLAYNGVISIGDLNATPLEGVVVSYETASTVSDAGGTFTLPVPDEPGVVPVLSKQGWTFTLSSTEAAATGILYRYTAVPALESRSYALWDAAVPGLAHTLKVLNKGSSTQTPTVTLYGQDGSQCGAPRLLSVAPMGDARIDLSTTPCLAPGTIGVVEVSNAEAYDGEFESLIPKGGDVDIRTSSAMPLVNGLFGPSYVTFDTGAAVLDRKLDRRFVENALVLGNVSDQTATFTVTYLKAGGGAYTTQRVTIAPHGVARVVVGDLKQKKAVSGLVQITPESDTVEYVGAMRRYGYTILENKKKKVLEKGKNFYVLSDYARVGNGQRFGARFEYANLLDGESYLEVANISNQPKGVTIEHSGLTLKPSTKRDKNGKKLPPKIVSKKTSIRISVPPLGTQRVKFSRFIKGAREGTLSVVSDVPNVILMNVVTNTYTPKRLLSVTKLSPLLPSFGDELHGFFESAPPSTIMISNMASERVTATLSCFVNGGLVNVVAHLVPPLGSVSSKLAACFGGASVGIVHVNSSKLGALAVDRVELRKPSGVKLRTRLR